MSPVVAAVFLVAVVVVMGSVVGVFVFDIASETGGSAPTVVFETEYRTSGTGLTVTIVHSGGDTLSRERLAVRGTKSGSLTLTSDSSYTVGSTIVADETVTPGEELVIGYRTSDGERSVLLRESVPSAVTLSSTGTSTTSPTTTSTSGGGGGGGTPGFRLPTVVLAIVVAIVVSEYRDESEA